MKTRHLILIALIIGLVFFLLFKRTTKKSSVENDEAEVADQFEKSASVKNIVIGALASTDSTAPTQALPTVATIADEAAAVRFSETVLEMGKCIGLSNMPSTAGKIDPVPDNLVDSIRSSLGEAVVQMDDWSQIEVVEKNGSVKRIRVDFDYPDGTTPMRRLSMFTTNSYGAAELVELTADESNNPNEAYIESLTEGLKINSDERAGRVYFSQGEELMFTVKNGKLQNFSFTRGNKNFSCSDMDSGRSRCICP